MSSRTLTTLTARWSPGWGRLARAAGAARDGLLLSNPDVRVGPRRQAGEQLDPEPGGLSR